VRVIDHFNVAGAIKNLAVVALAFVIINDVGDRYNTIAGIYGHLCLAQVVKIPDLTCIGSSSIEDDTHFAKISDPTEGRKVEAKGLPFTGCGNGGLGFLISINR